MLAGLLAEPLFMLLHFCANGTPQTVVACTQIEPVVKVERKPTFMLLVDELPLALAGRVQIYEAIEGSAGTLYVCEVPGHTVNIPVGV